MTSDATSAWVFDPAPPSGSKKGGLANAHVFDPELDYFVREVLQNANDQHLETGPVQVRFRLSELSVADTQALLSCIDWPELEEHLEGTAKAGGVTIAPRIKEGLKRARNGRLRVLLIEDSNTKGLTGGEEDESNFASLTRHELVTSADRKDSGGSFGLGKSVLWRYSDLSTVLFYSVTSDDDRDRFIGRTLLSGHQAGGKKWEGSGWFGAADPDGEERSVSVWDGDAVTLAGKTGMARPGRAPGTSILVLGFDDPGKNPEPGVPETCEAIVEAAVRWFWPAMSVGRLQVLVEGFDGDEQVFTKHADPGAKEVAPFLLARDETPTPEDTLEEPGDVASVEIVVSVPAQREEVFDDPRGAAEAVAELRVRRAESGEADHVNCVALQRGTGMVVAYEETKIRGGADQPFHSVLLAGKAHGDSEADHALEEFLRTAEPVAHEKWVYTTERIKAGYSAGYRKAVEKLFADINQAIKDLLRPEQIEGEDAPDALRKMFPVPGEGPPPRPETFRLANPLASLNDGRWDFSGQFLRRPSSEEEREQPWKFTIGLRIDQEGSGRAVPIRIAEAAVQEDVESVSGPDDQGLVTVIVPPTLESVSFSGSSAEVQGIPEDGLHRVRLRLEVNGSRAGGGA